MNDKKNILKNDISKKMDKGSVIQLIEKKIEFFKDVIQKTIIHVQKNKFLDILGISYVVICIEKLKEISKKIEDVITNKNNTEILINNLQNINNELSSLLKNYGTENLEDLLLICFGNNSKLFSDNIVNEKFELLKKYFHPISYKVLCKKDETKLEKNINETIKNFTCYDISSSYKQFHMKVYGLKLYIHSSILNKSLRLKIKKLI
jgi:hypothetical protein